MHHSASRADTSNAASVFGILYAEDFDDPPDFDHDSQNERVAPEPPVPAITQADVDAACAAAVGAARAEWQRSDEQKRTSAIASLGSALKQTRDAATQSAAAAAEATVVTILSIVTGLLPHFSRQHGPAEVRALLDHLLPTIHSHTRISVRVHADMVAVIQRDVAELEPDLAASIDVVAAPLEPGDIKVSWENGSVARDSQQIVQAVKDALGELGLLQPVEAPSKKRMAYAD